MAWIKKERKKPPQLYLTLSESVHPVSTFLFGSGYNVQCRKTILFSVIYNLRHTTTTNNNNNNIIIVVVVAAKQHNMTTLFSCLCQLPVNLDQEMHSSISSSFKSHQPGICVGVM